MRNILLLIPIISACSSSLPTRVPKEYVEVGGFYEKKVIEEARFSLNCEEIEVVHHEKYFHVMDPWGFHVLTDDPDTISSLNLRETLYPKSFRVSGCGKRVKYLLLHPSRARICDPKSYLKKICKVAQETDFTKLEPNIKSRMQVLTKTN